VREGPGNLLLQNRIPEKEKAFRSGEPFARKLPAGDTLTLALITGGRTDTGIAKLLDLGTC
jgi:hypothetical protein